MVLVSEEPAYATRTIKATNASGSSVLLIVMDEALAIEIPSPTFSSAPASRCTMDRIVKIFAVPMIVLDEENVTARAHAFAILLMAERTLATIAPYVSFQLQSGSNGLETHHSADVSTS